MCLWKCHNEWEKEKMVEQGEEEDHGPSRRCAVKEMVVMVGVCVWCHCEPNTFPSPPHLLLSLAELAMNGFLGQWGVEVEHPSSVVRASRVSASGWQVWGYQ
ncbi:hypothetical protein QJS10_CPB14g00948 [Acorus calamus]|uniref:Uncharacterized protein n=1 Tax=Acorus calamus TaxID=4465 RepID=A0AAV9DC97_ACOCL|nr:hypothetical protein QJS10_CPB14g00948 [Acorus calamus]